jgi:hypothetical protein
MVSSSYYGDYGYRGYGYNQQGGSLLGNTTMNSAYSSLADAPDLDQANVHALTNGISETYNNAMKPKDTGGGGLFGKIGDFFKGIVKGFTNLVKSLADPKTWLMIGAAALLCFIFPPAGYALLALGLFTSGSQILGGLTSGNMEQAGEGAFNLGLTALGAKGMGGAVKGKDGVTYTAAAGKAAKAANSADDAIRAANSADDAVRVAIDKGDDIANVKNLQSQAKQAHQHADDLIAAQAKAEARVAYQSTPKVDRKGLIKEKPTKNDVSTAKTDLDNARSTLYERQAELARNPKDASALRAVQDAESAVAQNALRFKQVQYNYNLAAQSQRGFFGRTWDSLGDNFTVMRGGKLADPKNIRNPGQGSQQQISLYNRGPKPPKAEAQVKGANQQQITTTKQQAQTDADALANLREAKPQGLTDKQYIDAVKEARIKADASAAKYQEALRGQQQLGSNTSTTGTVNSGNSKTWSQKATDTFNSTKDTVKGWFHRGDKTKAGQPTGNGQPTGMVEKAKGWFSPKLDKATGQPIDKGAAGYWNYLTSHKMQSWLQGYTGFGPLFGGQGGQQGGGMLSMFGLGGQGGQGGLLG